jgi:phosphoglycerol geranylgeranyltransferase
MASNRVETYLKSQLKKKNALIFVLIDSEISDSSKATTLAKKVEKIGASAILVGGSSASDQMEMAKVVSNIKKSIKIPIILFPGNVTGVVPGADATARGIPFDKPNIAAAYSLAAQYMGMRFVYLEAGSGAKSNVKPEMVKTVRKIFNGFLIVGGGIKDAKKS